MFELDRLHTAKDEYLAVSIDYRKMWFTGLSAFTFLAILLVPTNGLPALRALTWVRSSAITTTCHHTLLFEFAMSDRITI